MINYDNFYEDNLLHKHEPIIQEYDKYNKLFINKNSKCPIDIKTLLDREEKENQFTLGCKLKDGKKWEVKVTRPKIINLHEEKMNISEEYKSKINEVKEILKMAKYSLVYNADHDKKVKDLTEEIKVIEAGLDGINNIFEMEKESKNEIITLRKKAYEELAQINVNKKKLYRDIPNISEEVKNKLKEIVMNEGLPSSQRLSQIAKNVNLKIDEVEKWLKWLDSVREYVTKNKELYDLNTELQAKEIEFRKINEEFIISPPTINIVNDSKKEVVIKEEPVKKRKIKIKK